MYTIKLFETDANGNVTGRMLYHPLLPHLGYVITAGTVDLELGKAGSASITIPKIYEKKENGTDKTHPAYTHTQKMKTVIQIMDDRDTTEEEVFFGRILQEESGIDGRKKLFCEGALTFLIDKILVPPAGYVYNDSAENFFGLCVTTHNNQSVGHEPLKIFTLANEDQTETFTYVSPSYGQTALNFEEHEYSNVQNALYNKLIDVCGGCIKVRYIGRDANMLPIHTIDLVADGDINDNEPGAFHHCGQEIRIGKNLLDYTKFISGKDLATVIVPLGKMQTEKQTDAEGHEKSVDLERVNIAGYTDGTPHNPQHPGELYVTDDTAEGQFGNIWNMVIFDDVEDPDELYAKAIEYKDAHKNLSESLTISAVDLSLVDVDASAIHLGDYVTIKAGSFTSEVQCVKIHIDLLNPAASKYTFESARKTLSDMQSATENKVKNINATISTTGGMSGGNYQLLEQRVYNLERGDNITTTTQTTIMGIYNALTDMRSAKVYLGNTVTDRPHESGTSAVGGVLEVRRITALYGSLTYYANNSVIWCANVKEDPDNAGQQLMTAWSKIVTE